MFFLFLFVNDSSLSLGNIFNRDFSAYFLCDLLFGCTGIVLTDWNGQKQIDERKKKKKEWSEHKNEMRFEMDSVATRIPPNLRDQR